MGAVESNREAAVVVMCARTVVLTSEALYAGTLW